MALLRRRNGPHLVAPVNEGRSRLCRRSGCVPPWTPRAGSPKGFGSYLRPE